MGWRRLGLVYVPDRSRPWAQAHAMLPTPLRRAGGGLRVFLASTDAAGVGRIGFVDLDPADPTRVLRVKQEPALDIGRPGSFDDHGVNPCSVLVRDGRLYLYYVGYQLRAEVPYTLFTGLAVSDDEGESFRRHCEAPVLAPSDQERCFRTAAHVVPGGEGFRLWYIGGSGWTEHAGKRLPRYSLRYAESPDGLTWPAAGAEILAPREPEEIGFGRPFITREGGRYHLWYSVRRVTGYRLAHAVSPDGLAWERRDDDPVLAGEPGAWEAAMQCYPAVFETEAGRFLLYNGDGYGRTGLGLARLEGNPP